MLPVFWFFVFFIASGFCSLVYQIVWLRVAMADFGVTTPLISIVLSIFMGLLLEAGGAVDLPTACSTRVRLCF
jgi:hypothetical protein